MEKDEGAIQSTTGTGHSAHLQPGTGGADMINKVKKDHGKKGFTAQEIVWKRVTRTTLSDYPSITLYRKAIEQA